MSARIAELIQKRNKLITDMREINDRAGTEKRALSAEEEARWSEMDSEQERLAKEIKREERQLELEKSLASEREPEERQENREKETAEELHQRAFRGFLTSGLRSLTEAELRALSVGTDSEGGYTVAPTDFRSELIKTLDASVFMRAKGTIYTMARAKKIDFPTLATDIDDADWTTEVLTGNLDAAMAFGQLSIDPQPLAKRVKVSRTLLRDSVLGVEALIRERLAYKFAVTQEKGFLTGAGTSEQPRGIFNTAGLATGRDVSTGNTTTAVTFDGLIDAIHHVRSAYRAKAEWVAHDSFYKQVRKIKDDNGQYIWQQSTQAGQPDRLLGYACNESEFAPSTFTAGQYVAVFGDLSYYYIVDVESLGIQRLDELYAETNQVGFIGRLECSARPALAEAFARVKLAAS